MEQAVSRRPHVFQSSPDAGKYLRYMSEFVGFRDDDVAAVRETRFIVEKYLPKMIGEFYALLLRYPPTRKYFLKKDGTIDQEYLQLRMHHQNNFWRRVAAGVYDDEFASFVDYVGKAHTSHGADPHLYIPERYVIGMVGFVQHSLSEALHTELNEVDPDLESRAVRAWNLLCMVLLEVLSRAYGNEHMAETYEAPSELQDNAVLQLALETYERGLGIARSVEFLDVVVAKADEIPDGERKIVQVEELSIGVFHHRGEWIALRNSCLHRGGPVCTGSLDGDIITCPWHGYTYDVTNGQLTIDHTSKLEKYPVEVLDGEIHLRIPRLYRDEVDVDLKSVFSSEDIPSFVPDTSETIEHNDRSVELAENEFRIAELPAGKTALVKLKGRPVCVYNVDGLFYATQDECTHADGPLNEGYLEGKVIECPWHASCFDVTTGKVLRGPADFHLKTYRVVLENETGRVEEE